MSRPISAQRPAPRRIGFTIIELLVVVAIIGILAALLLPTISLSKAKAQRIQCTGNLHQLGLGLQNFVADRHAYPSVMAGTNSDDPGPWYCQIAWGGLGVPKSETHFLSEGVWLCPSARWPTSDGPGRPISYGYNAFGVLPIGNHTNALGLMGRYISASDIFAPVRESDVVSPSEMMAIGDSLSGGVFFMRSVYLVEGPGTYSRHQGRVNVLLCDGHVESPTLTFTFRDTSEAALVRWNRDHQPHRDSL